MNIAIIGTGYVGLVTGACLAECGNDVICIDNDRNKVDRMAAGELPFYEPGLGDVVRSAADNRNLYFSSNLNEAAETAEVIFLTLGTPSTRDGKANTRELLKCVRSLTMLRRDCIVVVKSTVPVGTCERIQEIFDRSARKGGARAKVCVASNPEFLAEGRAVADFRNPERIVVGTAEDHAATVLRRLYAPFDPEGTRLMLMDLRSAEFSKYACNAMLAARVSFINELADIAGPMGADIRAVCRVLTSDSRIGSKYLYPGAGYGGSCLPKDLRALIRMAQEKNEPALLLRSIQQVNHRQTELLVAAIATHFSGRMHGRCVAVWGVAFKPGTDDIREAPSVRLIEVLLAAGVKVRAYDPVAGTPLRRVIHHPALAVTDTARQACTGADVLAVMTDWDEFRAPDFNDLAVILKTAAIFDGRNLYDPAALRELGLCHYSPWHTPSLPEASIRTGGAGKAAGSGGHDEVILMQAANLLGLP